MGKPTGFLEYERKLPPERPVRERIADWSEFHLRFEAEEQERCQGSRCMDCAMPFCHSGVVYDGAASGCPLHNLIPEWNDLMHRGLWREAWDRLRAVDPFPEFTGRVCPAPCEGACTLGIHAEPVAIRHNEHAIDERAWAEGQVVPRPPLLRTGKRVAIVGSGPSGLACAESLNRAGHEVTVYEKDSRPGGILMYGIPNMKLEKSVVLRRVDIMRAEGIVFMTGTEVGARVSIDDLLAEHDAIVLCLGSRRPRDLAVPGRDLDGIRFALDYLGAATRWLLDAPARSGDGRHEAAGKDVVVIGGGDSGADCVGTAIRQGCRSVVQLEILPKPSPERTPDNPWPRWPRVLRTDYGQEEAMEIFGEDPRRYLVTAKAFEGEDRVKAVRIVDVEWRSVGDGRPAPMEVPGSERLLPADLVVIAMGFLGPDTASLGKNRVGLDAQGRIGAEFGVFATALPRVFAAGDARRGQSLVVTAIHEGQEAARAVDRYLMEGGSRWSHE
jgi:glutamate synthase (NADPH/NADH) small chain